MFVPFDQNAVFPTKHRSTVEPDTTRYEELEVSDEQFSDESSDMAEEDRLGKWKK
jgi:hypothetical protein